MSTTKRKSKTLSEKISDALKVPDLQDPEDDIYEDTKAKIVEADSDFENEQNLEAALSSFRKQNAKLLQDVDKKYAGKAVSRKSLYPEDISDSNDEGITSDSDNSYGDDSVGRFVKIQSTNSNDEDEVDEDLNEPEEQDSFDSDSDISNDVEEEEDDDENACSIKETSDFKHVKDTNMSESVQKGQSVCQQLQIWEKMMKMRINLQAALLKLDKFPICDDYTKLVANANEEQKKILQDSKTNVTNLLNKLLNVQQLLLNNYPETKNLLKSDNSKKVDNVVDMNEEIPSETEPSDDDSEVVIPNKKCKISDFPNVLSSTHEKYKSYRNGVIQKWHDKVRVASGAVNHKNLGSSSLIQHIEYVLSDKERLLKRTQLSRSNYETKPKIQDKASENDIEEKKVENQYDPETFNDDDFYHQLLRELIEYKTANVTDPIELSKQSIELQQLRNKMKRKIDTKATKGRRIRYTVHPKLVNFMAPEDVSMWTDEAKDELFKSLFGKDFEKKG